MTGAVEAKVGLWAVAKAYDLASKHIEEAKRLERGNIAACLKYLEAAREAVNGLEVEVDEILIETKLLAQHHWFDAAAREALDRRIEEYLNKSRLQTVLKEAIEGLGVGYEFAARDAERFFQWGDARTKRQDATKGLVDMWSNLNRYLRALSGAMALDKKNYAGGSGINLPELLEIQRALGDAGTTPARLLELAAQCQRHREREGIQLVGSVTKAGHELQAAFAAWGVRAG